MQQPQEIVFNASSDIVFNASEEAQVSKRRVVEQRIRDRFRGGTTTTTKEQMITSPRQMTINVPSGPSAEAAKKRDRSMWHPPQEILVGGGFQGGGGGGGGEEKTEGKPPQTIEVKGLGAFLPPKEIVLVEPKEDSGHVPDIIQISDHPMIPNGKKQAATAQQQRSLSGTEVAVRGTKSHHHHHHHLKRKAPPKQQQKRRSSTDPHQRVDKDPPPLMDIEVKKELPSVGNEITVIMQSEPETTTKPMIQQQQQQQQQQQPQQRHSTGFDVCTYHHISCERRRHSAEDPPAAKAATTNRHVVLPDFSTLAATNNQQTKTNKRRSHRKNILDFSSDDNNNINPILHQSWPVVQGGGATSEMIATNLSKANRSRVPQWLGVTGTPEDWIKPDDPRQIGRKIASQRMEI